MVFDGSAGNYLFYLNGQPIGTTSYNGGVSRIQANNNFDIYFNGYLDELHFYDLSLTPAEVEGLFLNAGSPVIRMAPEHNATVGTNFSLSLAADNGPTTYLAEGLPAGLSLNVATGEISGIAQDPGYHRVHLTASNDHGKTSEVVAIHARPAIDDDGWPVDVPDGSSLPQNGMFLWLDANDVDADDAFDAGTDHLHLANWADKAGKDHNATQATAAHQPEIRKQLLPNPALNLLLFDGNQSLSFPAISQVRTGFWVVERGDECSGASTFFADSDSDTWRHHYLARIQHNPYPNFSNGLQRRDGENIDFGATNSFLNELQVITIRTTDFVSADVIGKRGSDNYFSGKIGEILVYDRALTESEIRLVEQYLGSKWGIALNQEPEEETEAGLIGYWNFDEDEGTTVHDLSGNDKDGGVSGTTESDVWQDGILGASVRLDGLNDTASIYGHVGEQKTFSLWFDPGIALEDNGTAVRLCYMGVGSNIWEIWLNDFNASIGGEIISVRNPTGETTYVTEANANLADDWNHLALVWDGGLTRYRMYLNGTEADVNASAEGHAAYMALMNKNIHFAYAPTGAGDVRYAGKIDEFRLYDYSLSAAEVLAQYQYPSSDADNDGLTVTQEWNLGTDEDDDDSDDDGYSDGLEVSIGTDPLDPTSMSARFGLQVHLPFDGADGNLTADASGNNRPGTLVGFESNQTTWVAGKIGNAIQFDGVNDWGSIPYSLDANFTIALWLKSTETGGTSAWYQQNTLLTGPNDTYGLFLRNGKFAFWLNSASENNAYYKVRQSSASNVNTRAWVHVALSREAGAGNSGSYRTYINGSKDSGPFSKGVKFNTGALLYFGKAITSAENYLDGSLDDLRIYDRTLSDAEVKALYDLGQ